MRRTAWTAKMLELLSDGKWHLRTEVQAAGMTQVPPAMAVRRAEYARTVGRKARERAGKTASDAVYGDEFMRMAAGAKNYVNNSIAGMVQRGLAEQKKIDGVFQIRGFPDKIANPRGESATVAPKTSKKIKRPEVIKIGTDGDALFQYRCDLCTTAEFADEEAETWEALAQHIKTKHPVAWMAVTRALSGKSRQGPVDTRRAV